MDPTILLYMEDMKQLSCKADVIAVDYIDSKSVVYLDQTVFYPQGGGQPYDTGTIMSSDKTFIVEEVRFADGRVQHIGHFQGDAFIKGDSVTCNIDGVRRQLHARLHSGGHVLDMAVNELGYGWIPGKGYHFPDGPYVEYQGDLGTEDKEAIIRKLNDKITDILSRGVQTKIRFMPKEEMSQYCRHVPDYLPAGKPSRIVLYGNFGVPCGGTHVAALEEIGQLHVRKIKGQSGTLRLSYLVK